MSILVRFYPKGMTAEQYDKVSEQVQSKTDWLPDGLELHTCFGSDGDLKVSEIWDSEDQFRAFGQKLGPVLQEGGIEFDSEPEIIPVHRIETR